MATPLHSVHGEGPPVILLRGLGRTVKHWLGYERTLAEAAGLQIITMDLRGIGESPVPCAWTTSIVDMADDIVAVLDARKLPSAHVVGVSLGGMVTLGMGLAHPERCRSLAVVNTSIAGQGVPRLWPRALLALSTAARYRDRRFHARLVDVLVGRTCPPPRREDIARQYHDIAEADGLYPVTVAKQLVAAARFTVRRDLRKMEVPTLVIYGTDDRFVPNVNSRKLARILPHARLEPILGGGHELSLDKPDELAQALRRWVVEHEANAAARPSLSARTDAARAD